MLRIYPDVNVIQAIVSNCGANELVAAARRKQFKLQLSQHIIYEIAGGCLDRPNTDCHKTLAYLMMVRECIDLRPEVRKLIKAEFHLAQCGMPLITIVDLLAEAATWELLERVRRGTAEDVFSLIHSRDHQMLSELVRYSRQNRQHFNVVEGIKRRRALKRFEDFEKHFRPKIGPGILKYLMSKYGSGFESDVDRILNQSQRFPIVNTFVNTSRYIMFVQTIHKTTPAKDKLDDFRHVVESANCDQFITGDTDLLARSGELCPFRPTITLDKFLLFLSN